MYSTALFGYIPCLSRQAVLQEGFLGRLKLFKENACFASSFACIIVQLCRDEGQAL